MNERTVVIFLLDRHEADDRLMLISTDPRLTPPTYIGHSKSAPKLQPDLRAPHIEEIC